MKIQCHILIMDPDLNVKVYGEQVSDPKSTHCGRQKTILYSISISFVLMSDLGQAQCQALFGVEILNFFFFSYVTIH